MGIHATASRQTAFSLVDRDGFTRYRDRVSAPLSLRQVLEKAGAVRRWRIEVVTRDLALVLWRRTGAFLFSLRKRQNKFIA